MKTNIRRVIAMATALLLSFAMTIGIPVVTRAQDYEKASDIEADSVGRRSVEREDTVGIADVDISLNSGYIDQVNEDVEINTNNAIIDTNNGTIETNTKNGEVTNNHGEISNNSGNLAVNCADGMVGFYYGGWGIGNTSTIKDNFGTVRNSGGVIEINHESGSVVGDGTVEMNLGTGQVADDVDVLKQMWKIVSDVWDNLTTADGTAGDTFVENDSNGDFKDFWLWENGSVTLSASDNTKIISGLTTNGDATITDNGNGTWTISGISENIVIDVVFDEAGNPVPVRVRKVTENEEETGSGNNTADTAPVTGNVLTAAQIQALIESVLAESFAKANGASVTVIDLYLGNDPSLTADAVAALCTGSVAKRCHFTHNGQKSVLFVPVIDTTSIAYQQSLTLLDAEPGKQAGPIRLSQIFAPIGVTLSQE